MFRTNNSIEEEEYNIDNINNDNVIENENSEDARYKKKQEMNIINAGKKEGIMGLIKKTNQISKERNYLEVDEVKEKIKDILYNNYITKIYLWLHKHSASYRSIEEEERDDFDILATSVHALPTAFGFSKTFGLFSSAAAFS